MVGEAFLGGGRREKVGKGGIGLMDCGADWAGRWVETVAGSAAKSSAPS